MVDFFKVSFSFLRSFYPSFWFYMGTIPPPPPGFLLFFFPLTTHSGVCPPRVGSRMCFQPTTPSCDMFLRSPPFFCLFFMSIDFFAPPAAGFFFFPGYDTPWFFQCPSHARLVSRCGRAPILLRFPVYPPPFFIPGSLFDPAINPPPLRRSTLSPPPLHSNGPAAYRSSLNPPHDPIPPPPVFFAFDTIATPILTGSPSCLDLALCRDLGFPRHNSFSRVFGPVQV